MPFVILLYVGKDIFAFDDFEVGGEAKYEAGAVLDVVDRYSPTMGISLLLKTFNHINSQGVFDLLVGL